MIPLVDVLISEGTFSPAQIVSDAPKGKDGTVFGVTVTAKLAGKAHCPAAGVKL